MSLTRCSSSFVFSCRAAVLMVCSLCVGFGSRDALPSRRLVLEAPLGPALLEAPGGPPGLAQLAHRLVGVGAERSSAVRDDLAVERQLGESLLELVERDRARTGDVAGLELLARADVDEHDLALPQTCE